MTFDPGDFSISSYILGLASGVVLTRLAGNRPSASVPPQALSAAAEAAVRGMIRNGNKIAAIKHVRRETGATLRDAKERVESMSRNP